MDDLISKSSYYLTLALLFVSVLSYGQSSVLTTGGEASSQNGSVSFSIGQVDYSNITTSQYNVSEGVQQPFELYSIDLTENNSAVYLNLYPNPTSSKFWLDLNGDDKPQEYRFTILNKAGQAVIEGISSELTTSIDVSTLSSGLYTILVSVNDNTLFTKRFTKL